MQHCRPRSYPRTGTGHRDSSSNTGVDKTTGIADNFQDLPDAADHAAAEPEPAGSARHQPVHPAAGAVRGRRAAAQVERSVESRWSISARATQATQALVYVGNNVAVDGSTAQFNDVGDMESASPTKTRQPPSPLRIQRATTAYTGKYALKSGQRQLSYGMARAMTAFSVPKGPIR